MNSEPRDDLFWHKVRLRIDGVISEFLQMVRAPNEREWYGGRLMWPGSIEQGDTVAWEYQVTGDCRILLQVSVEEPIKVYLFACTSGRGPWVCHNDFDPDRVDIDYFVDEVRLISECRDIMRSLSEDGSTKVQDA